MEVGANLNGLLAVLRKQFGQNREISIQGEDEYHLCSYQPSLYSFSG
jgi:hypothetical protein